MPINQAATITLSEKQRKILEAMKKGTHTPLHLIQRSTIILMASDGVNNKEIARQTGWNRNTVKQWRNRWAKAAEELKQVEADRPHALKSTIESVLRDEQRSGKPSTFTDEEVAHILTLACQSPESLGLPFSHWTPGTLARQAIAQGIVDSISTRTVGRFLKRSGSQAASKPLLVKSEH